MHGALERVLEQAVADALPGPRVVAMARRRKNPEPLPGERGVGILLPKLGGERDPDFGATA